MPQRERFQKDDYVTKGQETGRVVELVSQRTGRAYLTVWILTGPRKNQREFPEKGWTIDDGRTGGNDRPAHELEDYVGSQDWKTKHHSRAGHQ